MTTFTRAAFMAAFLCLPFVFENASALETGWSPLLIARFGNIDALDAEDGDLARFIKNVRNDGRFIPPMRTLVGPEIRNPTFFGVVLEGWIECVVLAPDAPGTTRTVWAFPVDNRDEYLTHMINQGFGEYEGMDGVTVLRESDSDGGTHIWHLEWLPGNVAVFGRDRNAVAAARRIYADRSASRGLLQGPGGRYVNPDVAVRLDLPALASWQAGETGAYWWRDKVDRLARDLVDYWRPNVARERLLWSTADALALWPRNVGRLEASFWFEPEGVEWRLEADGGFAVPGRSQLRLLRTVPDRTALATASPVTPASLGAFTEWLGDFLLAAAGGVATREAGQTAADLSAMLMDGGIGESVGALVPPPTGNPDLGGARLIVMEWRIPEQADRLWARVGRVLGSDETAANAFAQMGIRVEVTEEELDPGTLGVAVYPAGDAGGEAYYRASWTYRREGEVVCLVTGEDRRDAAERARVREYRANLAAGTVGYGGEGGADARAAFTRMGPDGASWLGFFEPVRFLQFCLLEAADWRPRSPDQLEPLSTQLAREMLEYNSGRAWTAVGESRPGNWRFEGGLSWDSLSRLAAALGITEAIGM